jgi:excisionase family DNA binding protein
MRDENLKKLKEVHDLDAMLTIQDVADLLKVSPRQIHNLVKRRQVPQPFKLGRSVRFRLLDIRRFIDGDEGGLMNQAI